MRNFRLFLISSACCLFALIGGDIARANEQDDQIAAADAAEKEQIRLAAERVTAIAYSGSFFKDLDQAENPILQQIKKDLIESRNRNLLLPEQNRIFGAFFHCDPYCESIGLFSDKGIDESKGLEGLPPEKIVYLASDTELFKSLFPMGLLQKAYLAQGTADDGKNKGHVEHEIQTNKPGFFARIKMIASGGIYGGYNVLGVTSDYDLNADLKSKFQTLGFDLGLEFGYIDHKIWGGQIRNGFRYLSDQASGRKSTGEIKQPITSKATAMRYELVWAWDQTAVFGIVQSKADEVSVGNQSPRLYGTRNVHLMSGLGFRARRFYFEFLTNLSTKVSEDQRYKAKPFQAILYEGKIQYLHPADFGKIRGAFLIGLKYRTYKEESGIDPTYLVSQSQAKSVQTTSAIECGYRFSY